MEYEAVIGLETHVQLKSKSKAREHLSLTQMASAVNSLMASAI